MRAKPCVVEVVDQRVKIAVLKQLGKRLDLDLPVRIQASRVLLAKDQQGKENFGILVFSEQKDLSKVDIKWIYVKKIWRRLSIGRSLIEYLEHDSRSKGISTISVLFDQDNCGMHGLAGSSYGWGTCGFFDAYTFSTKAALAPALIKGEATMQKKDLPACIVPLSKCNDQELLPAVKAKKLPQWAQIDELLLSEASREWSRIFYLKDHVIGWLITVPLATGTLNYQTLWVDQEHRYTGIMVKGLAEVMRAAHLQESHGISRKASDFCFPWEKGFFMVHAGNQPMTSWVKKRLTQGKHQKSSLILREKSVEIAATGEYLEIS